MHSNSRPISSLAPLLALEARQTQMLSAGKSLVETQVAGHKRLMGGLDIIPKSPSGKILRNNLGESAKKDVVPEEWSRL